MRVVHRLKLSTLVYRTMSDGYRRGGPRGGGFRQRHTKREPWFGEAVQSRAPWRGRGRGRGKRLRRGEAEPPPEPHRDLAWYQTLFGVCVDRELQEEQLQVEERLETWPLSRLLREGYALTHCRARRHGRLFEKPIVRFYQANGLAAHIFTQGDLVTIAKSSPLERVDAEGVVYEKRASFLSVVFDRVPNDLMEVEWRLDKGSNKVAYERMHQALLSMCVVQRALPMWLRPCLIPSAMIHSTQQDFGVDPFYIQRATLVTADPFSARASVEDSLHSMQSAVSGNGVLDAFQREAGGKLMLNPSQLGGIQNGLESRLSLIQGPPGTGKTSTAVHLIKIWRKLHPRAGPILATAQSNVAVDQLLSGCLKLDLKAVRLGQPVRVTEELQGKTLDAQLQQHPRMAEVEALRDEIQRLNSNRGRLSGAEIGFLYRDLGRNTKQLDSLLGEISREVVGSADVVCATCIGAGSDLLKDSQFSFIVLDEATQCTEPEALVPLVKATADASVVLIGDHQQLPPTVLSQHTDSQRVLGISLFQRIAAIKEHLTPGLGISSTCTSVSLAPDRIAGWIGNVEPYFRNIRTTMLQMQYRMHPVLSQFPSQKFYRGQLSDGVSAVERPPPTGIPWPVMEMPDGDAFPVPLLFVACPSGREETSSKNQSKFNRAEASVVVSAVSRLLAHGGIHRSDIGIISPYAAQVQTIKSALVNAGHPVVRDDLLRDDEEPDFIEVKTVDGYQGREKDVIVFSSVRSNAHGEIGFLEDYRRFNVAMTRARRGLIVVGQPDTLKHDALWNDWLQYVNRHGLHIHESQIV